MTKNTAGQILVTKGMSHHYHEASNPQYELGEALAEELKITEGEHVLDNGCGTGRLTSLIAKLVGPNGRVVGTDLAEGHVYTATKNNDKSNVSFQQADAHHLPFPNDYFDVVFMNANIHWMNKRKAIKEGLRVLKAGGRLGFSTELGNNSSPYLEIWKRVRVRHGLDPTEGIPDLSTQSELENLFKEEGVHFSPITFHPMNIVKDTPKAMVDFLDASWSGMYVGVTPEDKRSAVTSEIEQGYEYLITPQGVDMLITWLIAVLFKAGKSDVVPAKTE